jgi:hypothetical protein
MAEGMINRANLPTGYLGRVVYPEILNIQGRRWATENASQGDQWIPIMPDYARRKLRRYQSYPGGGRKLLVATDTLRQAMTNTKGGTGDKYHHRILTNREVGFYITVPYAGFVDKVRDITSLTKQQIDGFAKGFAKYITSGNIK